MDATNKNDYEAMVKSFAKEKSDIIFSNSSVSHATTILNAMLLNAEHKVEILSGTMEDSYLCGIIDSMKTAAIKIKNKAAIKIITCEETDNNNIEKIKNKVKEINKSVGEQVIEYIPAEIKGDSSIGHFCVVDNKAWRIEEPHTKEAVKKGEVKAKATFNRPEIGIKLSSHFEKIWEKLGGTI